MISYSSFCTYSQRVCGVASRESLVSLVPRLCSKSSLTICIPASPEGLLKKRACMRSPGGRGGATGGQAACAAGSSQAAPAAPGPALPAPRRYILYRHAFSANVLPESPPDLRIHCGERRALLHVMHSWTSCTDGGMGPLKRMSAKDIHTALPERARVGPCKPPLGTQGAN